MLPRRWFIALVVVSSALPAAEARATTPCPANQMHFGDGTVFTSTAAAFDSTRNEDHVQYDLVTGNLVMHQCCSITGALTDVYDEYDVTGVPAGTPVSLTVVLTVDGAIWTFHCGGTGCAGHYVARIIHGTDAAQANHSDNIFDGRIEHHDVVTLPLTIVAGQPERLEFYLAGGRALGGSHGSEAIAVISFTGLSAGMSIVSCQGFAGGVTPVRRSTWGQLKTRYR
jgi:hypothetical protein